MSQDKVADCLNQMMNAKKAHKTVVTLKAHSKLLLSILAIGKLKGYVKNYKTDGEKLTVELGKLNGCNAVKPRFFLKVEDIDKYTKRYLPARDIGILILTTNEGLMTHHTAIEKNIGGGLLAYIY